MEWNGTENVFGVDDAGGRTDRNGMDILWTSPLTIGDWSCRKCFSEPDRASQAVLHATLKGGERTRLRALCARNVGGPGRVVCAALRG
jgi:hypothetical protein